MASPVPRSSVWFFVAATVGFALAPVREASAESYGKKVQKEVQASWLVTVSDTGDLLFFGAAVTVPGRRPSAEFCGEWITSTPAARSRKIDEKVRATLATARPASAAERVAIRQKALAPTKPCEESFKRHCQKARVRVGRATRKKAIIDAKKAISELPDPSLQRAVEGYLASVLAQCPLDR